MLIERVDRYGYHPLPACQNRDEGISLLAFIPYSTPLMHLQVGMYRFVLEYLASKKITVQGLIFLVLWQIWDCNPLRRHLLQYISRFRNFWCQSSYRAARLGLSLNAIEPASRLPINKSQSHAPASQYGFNIKRNLLAHSAVV